jgi:hypothetical protein
MFLGRSDFNLAHISDCALSTDETGNILDRHLPGSAGKSTVAVWRRETAW